jgi:hypothetical protein
MRKLLVSVVAASALLWAALWLVPQIRAGGAVSANAMREPVASEPSASNVAAAAKPSLAALEPSPAARSGAEAAPKVAPAEGGDADNLTEDGRRLNAKALTLRRAFAAEQRDATWAAATEQRLTEYTATFELGDHEVESIECAASICRVQFALRGEKFDRRVYMLSRAISRMYSRNYALEPLAEVGGVHRMVVWTSRFPIDQQQASPQR